jgi:hypothetical protein
LIIGAACFTPKPDPPAVSTLIFSSAGPVSRASRRPGEAPVNPLSNLVIITHPVRDAAVLQQSFQVIIFIVKKYQIIIEKLVGQKINNSRNGHILFSCARENLIYN